MKQPAIFSKNGKEYTLSDILSLSENDLITQQQKDVLVCSLNISPLLSETMLRLLESIGFIFQQPYKIGDTIYIRFEKCIITDLYTEISRDWRK